MDKWRNSLSRRSLILGAGALFGAVGLSQVRSAQDLASFLRMDDSEDADRMPTVFIGHGSPMNAIEENEFTKRLGFLGKELPTPKAILCVSAHWLSAGTWVTAMEKPRTIHDFYGFPQALFDKTYAAPGDPDLARYIQTLSQKPKIQLDEKSWGLDHGTWAVLCKMFPQADIPVLQLSIDMSEPASFHLELGKALRSLRERGVLIVGSGNIVHNLRRIDWNKGQQGFDWAIEFDEWVKGRLLDRDFKALTEDFLKTSAGQFSVPTPDHYLPLLYVLGAAQDQDSLRFDFEGYDMGSISMRCLTFGRKV